MWPTADMSKPSPDREREYQLSLRREREMWPTAMSKPPEREMTADIYEGDSKYQLVWLGHV